MKRKKLVIISHTEHYKKENIITGWGATVNEVNFLADFWDNITHVACLYDLDSPKSALPYIKDNIEFVPISPYGGKSFWDKLLIFFKIPAIIFTVLKSIKGATEVQLRLPTSIGIFLLPLFSILAFRKFTFWVKYAGNWEQINAPLSYRFQKWWVVQNFFKSKVTINGFWDKQPKNCISFENPCLNQDDLKNGKETSLLKTFNGPFTFCFIGRIDEAKGILECIDAIKKINFHLIEKVHFVGDGDLLAKCKDELSCLEDKVIFHGFLDKTGVHEILKISHFLLLPSKSEGFPKVIAEAACYGVLSITSDVGSIPHYINQSNGFLWNINSVEKYQNVLLKAICENSDILKEKSKTVLKLAESFTFDMYYENLENKILKS